MSIGHKNLFSDLIMMHCGISLDNNSSQDIQNPVQSGLGIKECEMGKYGEAAILAVRLFTKSKAGNPVNAWKQAMAQVFPDSQSSRKKSCPKSTFLGLCEEGLVVGVAAGNYTTSIDNKRYALQAVKQLRKNPALVDDGVKLWKTIIGTENKVENSQMDVVISLWRNGLLDCDV